MRGLIFIALIGASVLAMPARKPVDANPGTPPASGSMKSLFPKQEWTNFALAAVNNSVLPGLKPSDAKSFCPNGMSAHNWVHLLAAMTKYESDFDPNQEYKESFTNGSKPIISTGLLQISIASGNGYGCGFSSTADIKDPKKNLECGVKILSKWVKQDGVVANGTAEASRGGARYWSVLRTKKLGATKSTLKGWCE